jgi:hypothetical protein
MKKIVLVCSLVVLSSFGSIKENPSGNVVTKEMTVGSSFSLINDTKDKISIHTGTGFVSLNKGAKTSIGCNEGKEVRWADNGKKGDVIFVITANMCGKTFKLSELMMQ